jgi:hypothetical protein
MRSVLDCASPLALFHANQRCRPSGTGNIKGIVRLETFVHDGVKDLPQLPLKVQTAPLTAQEWFEMLLMICSWFLFLICWSPGHDTAQVASLNRINNELGILHPCRTCCNSYNY